MVFFAIRVVAERRGATTWHPHHIAERYQLFTLIVLGEVVLSTSVTIQSGIDAGNPRLWSLAVAGALIVFALWWLYFDRPGALPPASLPGAVFWGYGHYLVFAAIAAVGAGRGRRRRPRPAPGPRLRPVRRVRHGAAGGGLPALPLGFAPAVEARPRRGAVPRRGRAGADGAVATRTDPGDRRAALRRGGADVDRQAPARDQNSVTNRWNSAARSICGMCPVSGKRWVRAFGSRARAVSRWAAGRIRSRSPQTIKVGMSSADTAARSSSRHCGRTPRRVPRLRTSSSITGAACG
ncbi:hypothetical protein DLE60_25140 [Micromonospora globispora]|nr:hypothetical protein DLE60_25140 [Micromonospora globispora]